MASPDGYRKALRLMKLAENLKNPLSVLLILQSFSWTKAEQRGQGEAIARNILEMTKLKFLLLLL